MSDKKMGGGSRGKAFTLIELLVVIAVIGVLSAIVLSSLDSSRQKGKIASIKSNLRNMIPQMSLSYDANGNYSAINTGSDQYRPNTVCTGPIVNMTTAIKAGGGFSRCLSVNVSGDSAQRWGATALIYSTTVPVQAWSVTPAGVVKWDAQGVNSSGTFVTPDVAMDWNTATAACAAAGGRLPTIEELKTLVDTQCEALGSTDCTVDSARNPPAFQAGAYWSGTVVPSGSANAYFVAMDLGFMSNNPKTLSYYVHCVRS